MQFVSIEMGSVASLLIENTYVRSFIKFILHLFTRKCQIVRICLDTDRGIVAVDEDEEDNETSSSTTNMMTVTGNNAISSSQKKKKTTRPEDSMVWRFAVSVYRSKQLKMEKTLIFGIPFNLNHVIKQIYLRKSINEQLYSPIMRQNLSYCLQLLNWVNVITDRVVSLQQLSYNESNVKHVALLEALWRHLMPDVLRRATESTVNGTDCPISPIPPYQPLVSADWGEVGFQGKDPKTDFRGMGMYGLLQLVYLAKLENGFRARKMLFESRHPRRYFPFAASGINVTSFVVNDLLKGRKLHRSLFQCIHNTLYNSSINITTAAGIAGTSSGFDSGSASGSASGSSSGFVSSPSSSSPLLSLKRNCSGYGYRSDSGLDLATGYGSGGNTANSSSCSGLVQGGGGSSSHDAEDEQYYHCEGGSGTSSSNIRNHSPDFLNNSGAIGCASDPGEDVAILDTDTEVLLSQFHGLEPAVSRIREDGNSSKGNSNSSARGSPVKTLSPFDHALNEHALVHTPTVLLQACMTCIHQVYVETYELFFEEWVADDPANIMAFQRIFGLTKQKICDKYKALQ